METSAGGTTTAEELWKMTLEETIEAELAKEVCDDGPWLPALGAGIDAGAELDEAMDSFDKFETFEDTCAEGRTTLASDILIDTDADGVGETKLTAFE